MRKPITTLWALRFGTARGWQWVKERTADDMIGAQLWLDVFQNDEPNVSFKLAVKQPIFNRETDI